MKRALFCIGLLIIFFPAYSQIGGQSAFSTLRIPSYTKSLALGGMIVSNPDENINFFLSNPALLSGVNNHVSFQHTFYFADIHLSQLSFAHEFKKTGLVGFSVQYFDLGKMDSYDETGTFTGEFHASDFVLTGGYAHQMGNFNMGVNLKFAHSDIYQFKASSILFDIGGIFKHPNVDWTVGLVLKNVGFLITDYTESSNSQLPFDARVATTFKPEHMPFRFSMNFHNITNGDITFDEENVSPTQPETEISSFDKVMRHFAFGVELLIGKHVQLMAGYNHLVKQELKVANQSFGSGISYGLQFDVKNFNVSYSRGHYAAGSAINQLGLMVDINRFIKKDI